MPLNSMVAVTGCGFHVVAALSSLPASGSMVQPGSKAEADAPVQHDNTISLPVGRKNAIRDICADDKGPVEAASDAHPYSLAPRSPTITRKDGLGSLSHGVEFLVDTPCATAVDLDDTSASASTAVGSRELRTARTIEREIPH